MAEKVILEVEFDSAQADKNVDELTKSIIALEAANKSLREDSKKSDAELKKEGKSRVDLAKQTEFNRQKIAEEKKERAASLKVIRSENNSRNQLKANIVKLKQARDKLDTSNKKEAKQIKELNKEIDKQNKKLGNTKSKTEGLSGAITTAVPGLSGFTSVMRTFGAVSKIALGPLGLLLTAFAALKAFFTGSEEGQDRLNKIMIVGKTIIGNIADSFRDFGRVILDSVLVLGARFTKFFAKIGLGWQKIKGIFKDNTAEIEAQQQKIVEAEKTIAERQDKRRKSTEELVKGVKGLIKETQNEIKIAEDLANRQNQLNKDSRKNLVTEAELRRDIANIRAKAADRENVDAETRLGLLDEAIKKENQILDNAQKLAKERLDLKAIENSLADSTKEDLEEQARLEAELITLETTNADKRRRLISERLIAERELKALEEEEDISALERELVRETEQAEAILKINEERLRKEVEDEAKAVQDKIELNRRFRDAAIDIAGISADAIFAIQRNNLQRETQAAINAEGVTEAEKLKIQKDAAKKQKQISITQAIINGALAIVRAFSDLGPVGGAISAVLIAATTAAQIAVINSQTFAKGGEVKFGSGGNLQSGIFSGPSHAMGGIGLTTDTGQRIEVEGNEGMYIVNKRDNPAAIAALSAINSLHGKAFSTPISYAQDGGQLAIDNNIETNRQIQEAISNLVIVTKVTDINNTQAIRQNTVNNAVINA